MTCFYLHRPSSGYFKTQWIFVYGAYMVVVGDVVWCGVMWCGVVWCHVVWCGVV